MLRGLLVAALATLAPALAVADVLRLEGHGGPVKDIAVAGDGVILTASFDYAAGIWADAAAPRWLEGHRAAVNTVLPLPDGRIATGGDDFDVRIWDRATGASHALSGHEGKVIALALAPGGNLLASAGWDGRVGLWPLDGGAPRFLDAHRGAVNDVAFAPDGRLFSASADGTVRVWQPADGTGRTLVSHGFGVNTLVMGPGGAWLAYGAVDGGTRVVDPASGAEIDDFTAERRPILAMALSPAGDRLAVGDGEGWVMILDTADWSVAEDFRAAVRGPVWALAWGPDGGTLWAGGISDAAFGWDAATLDAAEPALGAAPRPFLTPPEEMPNGERQFARKCSVCHTLTRDQDRRAGPPLAGLFGRPAGGVPGYPYSEALREADFAWTRETIDRLFDLGPDHFVPGTKMPMQRIADAGDRADLIDYLARATRE